jgi:MFS family permease
VPDATGRVGDLTGHRRQLVTGLTSLLAGLAPDEGVLIAARFAQGTSAAMVAPMTLACWRRPSRSAWASG